MPADEISILHATGLSFVIAGGATVLTALTAVPLAYLAVHRRYFGKSLVEGLLLLPLVLPPTVIGYALLVLGGRRGLLGHYLYDWWGYSIIFRIEGAILAAAIVSFPLLYLPARAAFAGVDPDIEDVAKVLGASGMQLFFRISLPAASRGVLAGILLAFARALGEFGATLMVYGWQSTRVTLPISIWAYFEQGDLNSALPAVFVMLFFSLLLILVYNKAASRPL